MWASIHDIKWWMVTAPGAKKTVLGNGRARKEEVLKWAKEHPITLGTSQETVTQHIADAYLYLEAWRRLHVEDPKETPTNHGS